MKRLTTIFFSIIALLGCEEKTENDKTRFLVGEVPKNGPLEFKQELVPANKLVHKGIFTPDLDQYYYTLSDDNFEKFDVYVVAKNNGRWSQPKKAFFNSQYNEHGMSFSPNGKTLYFSSTRPVDIDSIASTWHIWKSDNVNGKWSKPEFIDVPNLRDKLMSHPSVTNSGTIYFHSSNLDYSEMDLYYSKFVNGRFENAKKVIIESNENKRKCTPYVSPKEDYLLFSSIDDQLDLMISFKDGNGGWKNTRKLNDKINNKGQGNPYITPDNRYLFFTTANSENIWSVKWVDITAELKSN